MFFLLIFVSNKNTVQNINKLIALITSLFLILSSFVAISYSIASEHQLFKNKLSPKEKEITNGIAGASGILLLLLLVFAVYLQNTQFKPEVIKNTPTSEDIKGYLNKIFLNRYT